MKQFASDSDIPESSSPISLAGLEKTGIEINKLFCNKCLKFKPIT
jgi:hypothetical protein